ncbi:DNA mismatch repair protein MutL [bacterium HR26]|nr:DNA mismatch repair protein MutL [bacterium HR26]
MPIQVLDEATIAKIAAGEVIERPASVVKELVENALDAGARSVVVEIVAGGRECIRVRDDGTGMSAADLRLAIERHATSKLRRFEDLASLRTFGFRGEALASIAAVSDLEIVTRPADATHGHRLRSTFGRRTTVEPVAAAPGTVVSVRDLFANVPARRSFLRQEGTETAYIQRVVSACALAHPEVRFELVVDGRTALVTDGSGSLENALVGIFGAEVAAQMVPIASPDEFPTQAEPLPLQVRGYVGLPTLTRSNRQGMLFFVNRRWIESRPLGVAVEQAYHSLIMVGRYPVAVVHLELPPDRVDVNVHPTKREVRFSDERAVFSALQAAVRRTLARYTPAQSVPSISFSPLSPPALQRRLVLADPSRVPRPVKEAAARPEPREAPLSGESERALPVLRVLGQLHGTYIIAEGPDGLYLIDQHAAHERVLLEQLMVQYERASVDAQVLLEPLVVELTPAQLAVLEDYQEELRQLGFQVEPFGGSAVAIRAVPAVMHRRSPNTTLLAILDELAGGGRGTSRLEALAISTACHSAIRAGQELTLAEMRELVRQLEECTAPRACGHGRPTMLHLSQQELERQFARR